jgi:hypothetical protein
MFHNATSYEEARRIHAEMVLTSAPEFGQADYD